MLETEATKVEEYVGALSKSVTVFRSRCSNKMRAEEFVSSVKRETKLPFYWEEENTGTLRFFTESSLTDDDRLKVCNAAEKFMAELSDHRPIFSR